MASAKIKALFSGLNSKILAYFIAFAFVPLLIFSTLGYYLNKDLITRSNLNYLHLVNQNTLVKVAQYFQYKQSLLRNAVYVYQSMEVPDQPQSISQFIRQNLKWVNNEFVSVYEGPAEDGVLPAEMDKELPYVYFDFDKTNRIFATLTILDLQDMILSDVQDIRHELFIGSSNMKLTRSEYTRYDQLQKQLTGFQSQSFEYPTRSEKNEQAPGVISTYSVVSNPDLTLISSVDAHAFYAELTNFGNKIFAANMVMALFLVAAAIVSSRKITTPLHALIAAVQNIRKGNLDQRIELQSDDELHVLATEFEAMREKLQESYQGLENKIAQRTTELKEAQSQILHQEKMAALGLMAAGIAHEIGNPLTSISSMAQVIKRRTSDSHISEFLSNILKNIDRISRIVRELVDFSRPSGYTAAYVDINEVAKSAVGIVKYDRRSKYLNFALQLGQDIPKTFLVADHLLQVFINILINAVDALEGNDQEIIVKTSMNDTAIHIDIIDKGTGIPEDKLNQIFEPFYTTKEVGKGTGLGLSVSYGIIQKFKGEIKVTSKVGKGSTFTVILPVLSEGQIEQ